MENENGPKCTLTNEELIARCEAWVSKLSKTGGRAWSLRVPVDFNNDPDMLFLEMGRRLKKTDEAKGWFKAPPANAGAGEAGAEVHLLPPEGHRGNVAREAGESIRN